MNLLSYKNENIKVKTDYNEVANELFDPNTHIILVGFIIKRHSCISEDEYSIFCNKLMQVIRSNDKYIEYIHGDFSKTATIKTSIPGRVIYQNPKANDIEVLAIIISKAIGKVNDMVLKLVEHRKIEMLSLDGISDYDSLSEAYKKNGLEVIFGLEYLFPHLIEHEHVVQFVVNRRDRLEKGTDIAITKTLDCNKTIYDYLFVAQVVAEYIDRSLKIAGIEINVQSQISDYPIIDKNFSNGNEIPSTKPTSIFIQNNFEIYLPELDIRIELSAIRKTLFLFFLLRNDGVVLKELVNYKTELKEIYLKIRPGTEKVDETIGNLFTAKNSTLNSNLSEINKTITTLLKKPLSDLYTITGDKGKAYSIKVPREFITIQQ